MLNDILGTWQTAYEIVARSIEALRAQIQRQNAEVVKATGAPQPPAADIAPAAAAISVPEAPNEAEISDTLPDGCSLHIDPVRLVGASHDGIRADLPRHLFHGGQPAGHRRRQYWRVHPDGACLGRDDEWGPTAGGRWSAMLPSGRRCRGRSWTYMPRRPTIWFSAKIAVRRPAIRSRCRAATRTVLVSV